MDAQSALDKLDRDFSAMLATWPPANRERLLRLESRIWPGPCECSTPWLRRFNRLTILYPRLQITGIAPCGEQRAAEAMLAHACLVVYAYACDKSDDGQVIFDPHDTAAVSRLYSAAVALLDAVRQGEMSARTLLSMFRRPTWLRFVGRGSGCESRMADAAAASARLGFVSTACLMAYSGVPLDRIQSASMAYNHTVTAIQYADDTVDWREDLSIGDNNLLLGTLQDYGLDPYELQADDVREVNVGHALLRFGVFESAVRRAEEHLQIAIDIQQALGCTALVAMLEELREGVRRKSAEVERQVENDLIVGCLLANHR
jgi:hypothetical protein